MAATKGADIATTGEESILSGERDATEVYANASVVGLNNFTSKLTDERNKNRVGLEETAEEELADRLSSLPDCIIAHILSNLCTWEAVRTSVLSKSWTDVWTQVHVLDISGAKTKSQKIFENKFMRRPSLFIQFVDKVLSLSESAAQVLLLDIVCEDVSEQLLNSWVETMMSKQFREISIISSRHLMKLQATSFNSNKLVVLSLSCLRLDVQEGFSLPKLESLSLENVYFCSEDSQKNLLSGCSTLREAFIDHCGSTRDMMHLHSSSLKRLEVMYPIRSGYGIDLISINAPNLEYIDLSYNAFNYDITLPAIVEARIHLHDRTREVAVFRKVSGAKVLRLCERIKYFPPTVLDPPTTPFPLLPVFQNLLCLEIDVTYGRSFILFLLGHCPILETIIINNVFDEWASATEPDDKGYSLPIDDDPDLPLPMCLSSGLRHVEIHDFVSTEELLELAGYFLQNTVNLRKMYISICQKVEDRDDVFDQLMKLYPDSDKLSLIEIEINFP
ncbi:F-box/FBD/LRR-repeat protein-like protein [Drosera capensis]